MDTLGGLAFAGEAPSKYCMKEKPKRRDEPIMNRYMVNQIVILGSFTVALCLAFLLSPSITSRFRSSPDRIYHLTAFFALFIFTSVFNCFNARSDRLNLLSGISKNKIFIAIMSAISAVQILFVYLGGEVLRTVPPLMSELSFTLALSLLVFPAEFIRKLLWRLRGRKDGF
jgi:magnesium-transporting ATPase (P-type)